MKAQHKIGRQLTQPEAIAVIRRILENNQTLSRTEISKQVCEHFSFYDALNRPQWTGCLKALRELDDAGHVTLPVSRNMAPQKTPQNHGEPINIALNNLFQKLNLTKTYVCANPNDKNFVSIRYKSETRHIPLFLTSTHFQPPKVS